MQNIVGRSVGCLVVLILCAINRCALCTMPIEHAPLRTHTRPIDEYLIVDKMRRKTNELMTRSALA